MSNSFLYSDISHLSQNAVLYPSEDGQHLSPMPPGGGNHGHHSQQQVRTMQEESLVDGKSKFF
jgi:hypothetical protein